MTHPSGPGKAPVLVTGAAGFIGYHVARALLDAGTSRDRRRQPQRLLRPQAQAGAPARAGGPPGLHLPRLDLADRDRTAALFAAARPARVVHLAAQAGVRYSLTDPHAYIDANIVGFLNVLEGCRHNGVEHLSMRRRARSTAPTPRCRSRVHDNVDHPVEPLRRHQEGQRADGPHLQPSLPRCRSRACASSRSTGRGGGRTWRCSCSRRRHPRGRADRRLQPRARMRRDFTYIDDIVEGVLRADRPRRPRPTRTGAARTPIPAPVAAPYRLYNIGNHQPVELMHFIAVLEAALGRKAEQGAAADAAGRRAGDLRRRRRPRRATSASRRRRRSRTASRASWRGIGGSTGFDLSDVCLPRACPEDPAPSPLLT